MKGVLILNDIHIPFNRKDVLSIVEKHAKKIQAIIIGGDLIDCKSISVYPSLDDITIESEIASAIEFISSIRQIVGAKVKIIIIEGNHEARWKKYIMTMHDKKLYKFINPNILEMLKSGMVLYSNGEEKVYKGIEDLIIVNDWWFNYKGIIVCHPTNYYKPPCRNSNVAIEHFIKQGETFHTLVCAHNHHQGMCHHFGIWSIESGCLCQEFDYTKGKTTAESQDYGYVLINFKGKKVNKNKSRIYILDSEEKNERIRATNKKDK